jgi:hypothetical protein
LIETPEELEEQVKYFLPTWTDKREKKDIKIKGIFETSMKGEVGENQALKPDTYPKTTIPKSQCQFTDKKSA